MQARTLALRWSLCLVGGEVMVVLVGVIIAIWFCGRER